MKQTKHNISSKHVIKIVERERVGHRPSCRDNGEVELEGTGFSSTTTRAGKRVRRMFWGNGNVRKRRRGGIRGGKGTTGKIRQS